MADITAEEAAQAAAQMLALAEARAEAAEELLEEIQHKPTNVITAIAAVMAEIGGIKKLSQADRRRLGMITGDEGVKYSYRGIDQIASAAQPLMGYYGVVTVPIVMERVVTDIIVNAKPWTETKVEVDWYIYGPGGITDVLYARTIGLGRDNSDKGDNKAMTTAYKNLLLRLLCIGDPKDDTDQHDSTSTNDQPPPPSEPLLWSLENVAIVRERYTEAGLTADEISDLVVAVTTQTRGGVEHAVDTLEQVRMDENLAMRDAFRARIAQPPAPPAGEEPQTGKTDAENETQAAGDLDELARQAVVTEEELRNAVEPSDG